MPAGDLQIQDVIIRDAYNLETEISTLMKNSQDRNVEFYNVKGLLTIGNLKVFIN